MRGCLGQAWIVVGVGPHAALSFFVGNGKTHVFRPGSPAGCSPATELDLTWVACCMLHVACGCKHAVAAHRRRRRGDCDPWEICPRENDAR